MRKEREYMTLEELDETLGKPTPYCLHASLEEKVLGLAAVTAANTVMLIVVMVAVFIK